MTSDLPEVRNDSSQLYLVSGALGLVIGLISAYLFLRASAENGSEGGRRVKTMDALGLAVAMLSVIRQITDLGAGGKK